MKQFLGQFVERMLSKSFSEIINCMYRWYETILRDFNF